MTFTLTLQCPAMNPPPCPHDKAVEGSLLGSCRSYRKDKRNKPMAIKSKSVARHQAAHKRTGVWWTPEEYELLIYNAKISGFTVSQYIRHAALDKKIVPRTDMETLSHLMKLGGLQKKLIADIRASLADNADTSKLIADTNQLYESITIAIKKIRGEFK